MLPIIGVTFFVVLGRVRKLFTKAQEAIDWLNKVINESILGAALIRLLNSQHYEYEKFVAANTQARDISLSILRLFAGLIPVIMFADQPGHADDPDARRPVRHPGLDDASAISAPSTTISSILIFPVIMIGFMSNVMAQAGASYPRISSVLDAPEPRRERHARSPSCAATSPCATSS